MSAMQRLNACLKTRVAELREKRRQGSKIVGYAPDGFMPEELVWASGAIPIGLINGGAHEAVEAAAAYSHRWWDPFYRSQIGYWALEDPLYRLLSLIVVPVTNQHARGIAETFDYFTDIKVFRFGVPRVKEDYAYKFYLGEIKHLRERLEGFTGMEIEDAKLREAVILQNRIRKLLSEISEMRKSDSPPIRGKDFVLMNHASLILDPVIFLEILESLYDELKAKLAPKRVGPRVMLIASALAYGDDFVIDMLEEFGGHIVIEDAGACMRYYQTVSLDGDIMEALADRYLLRRLPPAWFMPPKERIDSLVQLAKEYDVAGVVWYELFYNDAYDTQAYYMAKIFEKEGIPMLRLESEWDTVERGALRTRLETFIEMLKSK